MPIGDSLTFDYPTTAETYAVALGKLKTILQTIEGILEQDIDTGSLDLTGALSLGGSYLYNLIRVVLSQVATAPTDLGSLYVDDDGELHIVTPNGDIKITLNGQINITSTGAIVGDYGAADEAVYYDQVSGEYRFFTDTSPEAWAFLVAKAFRAVKDAGAAGTATFGVEASVVTDLILNLKSLPGSGVGGLAYEFSSESMVDASTVRETLAHKFTDIDLTGDIEMTTGKVNHGDKYLGLPPNGFFSGAGSGSPSVSSGALRYTLDTTGGTLTIPTNLKPGDRIKSIRVAYTSPGGAPDVFVKWNSFASAYDVAVTIGSTETEFSTSVTDYAVDTPEALAIHENPTTNTLFAYSANIRIEAISNTTVIHGVSIVYDSIDVPTY